MKISRKQLAEEFGEHWINEKIDVFSSSDSGRATWTFHLKNTKHHGMVIYLSEIWGGVVFLEEIYERLLDIKENYENNKFDVRRGKTWAGR